jgi:tetratricopeptide (TPR) repeat protein
MPERGKEWSDMAVDRRRVRSNNQRGTRDRGRPSRGVDKTMPLALVVIGVCSLLGMLAYACLGPGTAAPQSRPLIQPSGQRAEAAPPAATPASADGDEESAFQQAAKSAAATESYAEKMDSWGAFTKKFPDGRRAPGARRLFRGYARMAVLVDAWTSASKHLADANFMPVGIEQQWVKAISNAADARSALSKPLAPGEEAFVRALLGTLAYENGKFADARAEYDKAIERYSRLWNAYGDRLETGGMACCLYNESLLELCSLRCRTCEAFERGDVQATDPTLVREEIKLISRIREAVRTADNGKQWAEWTKPLVLAVGDVEKGYLTLLEH